MNTHDKWKVWLALSIAFSLIDFALLFFSQSASGDTGTATYFIAILGFIVVVVPTVIVALWFIFIAKESLKYKVLIAAILLIWHLFLAFQFGLFEKAMA
jgi:hypothetical protein